MSYELDRWATLSPRRREAVNRLRVARGEQPIPPPTVDLYVAPPPRPVTSIETIDSELRGEFRAATARFDAMLRNGAEGFAMKGNRVEGLEVVETPAGYEGFTEGRRAAATAPSEGFRFRR